VYVVVQLNYLEFIEKILPADYPYQDERNMFADNIASMAYQDRKAPLGKTEIQSVREFIPAFQDKITAKSRGGGAELRRMFNMFDTTKKGYVTFDDLMNAAKRWNIEPCTPVREAVKKMWCPLVEDKEVLDFDSFVMRVLPSDFTDLAELQRVFFEKVTVHSGALNEIFRRMDVDKGGTIDKDEIMAELQRMNIQITPELADEFAKQFDEDGDGEIDFVEFSKAVRNMDPDKKKAKNVNPVGLLWEADQYARQRIEAHRPTSAESICSVAGDVVDADREQMEKELAKRGYTERPIAGAPLRNEELRDYTMPGKVGQVVVLEDGTCLVDGVPTDFIALLRDKIYAKFRSGFSPLLRLFKMMDAESNGKITLSEFERFLEPYNLNLSKVALGRLMSLFDKDGDGAIDYSEFCDRIMPDNYQKLLLPDERTGKVTEKMQGIPAMVWQPPRHFAEHSTPTVLAPFDSKVVPPYPADDRAVNLVREKVAQRSRNANDARAHIQLRDTLQLYDKAKNGRIPRQRFREALERYSVFLGDEEFANLCSKLPQFNGGAQVAYKPFLNAVRALQCHPLCSLRSALGSLQTAGSVPCSTVRPLLSTDSCCAAAAAAAAATACSTGPGAVEALERRRVWTARPCTLDAPCTDGT
jgi:Ca2+-binding EF-hand superfamily protein